MLNVARLQFTYEAICTRHELTNVLFLAKDIHFSGTALPAALGDHNVLMLASFPGLLTPAFVACSTNAGVLQATNAGVRRPPAWEQSYTDV